MIDRIEFENCKSLRHATLPLGRFTLIVGPNGSGKSTVFEALEALRDHKMSDERWLSTHAAPGSSVEIRLSMSRSDARPVEWTKRYLKDGEIDEALTFLDGTPVSQEEASPKWHSELMGMRVYSFDPRAIAAPATLDPATEVGRDGSGLVNVLEYLRDTDESRLRELDAELHSWLPEFDQLRPYTAAPGQKSFGLRQQDGGTVLKAHELSDGTLTAIAILALAHSPQPPPILCLEEPDRGIHPRLLRNVQAALYRLCYPDDYGEKRKPVQVIVTTHSPYFLDLYKDHPEEIVIASKRGLDSTFERLSDLPDVEEIIDGASLGEIWYTGILGGVPAES